MCGAYADASECSNPMSHVEQRSCLESQFKEAEKRLTLTEQKTMEKIAAWDEDAGFRAVSRKALSTFNSHSARIELINANMNGL